MYMKSLQLENYRNYKTLDLQFSPQVNVFIGENAQGKTNVMESIYVLAMTKSHRTSNDRDLIRWETEYGKIKGEVIKKYGAIPLQLEITKKGKKARANHLEQRKLSSYIGQLNVVMFAPEDLNIVKGSPQVRRRFLDMEIGQISPTYLHDLVIYQKLLKQRNAILKKRHLTTENEVMLNVYTDQFIQAASKIIVRRFYFMELLQKWARPIHEGISQGKEQLTIEYRTLKRFERTMSEQEIASIYQSEIEQLKQKELERGLTLIGPHRDDLRFYVNDYDVQTFGSQGQQRTTALSLKLAEIELVKQEVGEPPILLLDDVLSELDDDRQTHLLNITQGQVQTFVTTTNVDGISHDTIRNATMFEVKEGTVTQLKD